VERHNLTEDDMPITPEDYNNDAIKGQQLERLTKNVLNKVKEKQDILDIEYDSANSMIIANNISIVLPNS
jgi:hypothetical protein